MNKLQDTASGPAKGSSKQYDLEDRTFEFAKASRAFVKKLPRTIANVEDAKQFIRASGSIGKGKRLLATFA
jgi:hypothetical protein